MSLLRTAMMATILTAIVMSVSFITSLFAQQGVPEEPRPTAISPQDLAPMPENAVEIQTSGPIHEGFATPLTTEVPESIIVKKEPPQPIEELPPEQRPEGENVVWIPGYFAWDEDRNDFIWMSGFWRDVPPGRVWVSGYWSENPEGWQWVPGFWTSAEQNEVTYLPPPPETVEAGPSIAQPSVNHFWVPGYWNWVDSRYTWRPGYWSRIHPEWVWIPAHYVWCPSGYVFVNGYWDYPVVRRGLLFAPAYFQPVAYRRPYYFTPSIVWSTHLLTSHLWVRPAYYHYYFGDFYNDRYATWGIRPWYLSFTFGNTSYDPLFSYYRWRYRDSNWAGNIRDRYDFYRRNVDRRPPRTYRELQQAVARGPNRDVLRSITVAAPITQVVNNTTINNVNASVVKDNFDTPFRFDRMPQAERRQVARRADEMRGVVRQRRQIETRDNVARVEGGKREGGKATEDARVRQAAPRSLNIGGVAQAMGVTPDRRGRGASSRPRGDQQAAGRGREGGDASGRSRGDRLRPEIENAKTDEAPRARPGRAVDESTADVARPDGGPALSRPDRVRPEVTDVDRAGRGRGRAGDNRANAVGIDRQPDALRPDFTRPDFTQESRGRLRDADVPGRGRAASPQGGRPSLNRPDAVLPDSPRNRPETGERRSTRRNLNEQRGDRPDSVAPDRGGAPGPRRTIDVPQRGDASGRGGGGPADRPIPRPTLPGFGDPSTSLRQTPGRGSETGRERGAVTRDRGSSPVPDFSGRSRSPQGRSREPGTGQSAPLRLGGPQPSPRGTPRVETPRPQPRVERPAPRASGPSARPPAGESRSRGRSEDPKRDKDRD